MSDGGTWEPPHPSAPPPPPPPHAADGLGGFAPPPTTPTATVDTVRRGRSRGPMIAAIVGAVALVGAGVFAISRISSDSAAGGAATPEDAGLALLAAIENEDVLGAVDVLLPGERNTLRGPLTDLVSELRRLEVLSDDADLQSVAGIDIEMDDESVVAEDTNVDDIVNLEISATSTASIDGRELPVGEFVTENTDDDWADFVTQEEEAGPISLRTTAVLDDGRWYISAFHSVAESLRSTMEGPPDIPAEGIVPAGGSSPEAAMDNMIEAIEALDLEAMMAALNPDEFQALQRYAPIFLGDAQAELDAAETSLQIDSPDYEVSGSGDTRSLSISYLRVTVDIAGDPGTITLEDGCWTVEASGDSVNTCELADEQAPQLDDMFEDAETAEELVTNLQETFGDYVNPGFIVKEVDGAWYFSPMATGAEQVLAVIRSLSREEIEETGRLLSDAFEQLSDDMVIFDTELLPSSDELIEDYTRPGDTTEGTIDGTPDEPPPTTTDPADDCYDEIDTTEATACFQRLVDAGAIEPYEMPIVLRFPECGMAEIMWSADYYELPDAEFVAVVEQAAPCFQQLVTSGQLEEFDLPLEFAYPQCLEGRNWYTAIDDEAYQTAFDECAAR